MRSTVAIVIFILLSPFFLQSQTVVITEINYIGADHLDTEYLEQYISCTVGDSYDEEKLDIDVQRLRRLNGVSNATVTVDSSQSERNVTFHIEKRGAILPILGFGGIKDNLWFSLGFSNYNFQGKNQVLEAYYLNNSGRTNGKIFFNNERIKGSDWGFGFSAQRIATEEPVFFTERSVQYNYTNHALGTVGHYWLDDNTTIQAGITLFHEAYAKLENINIETPGPQQLALKKGLLKVVLRQNKLKYDYFYREGTDWFLNLQNVQTFSAPTPFYSATFEIRSFFRPTKKGNIAFRLKTALATNNDSPFAPFVLDSNFNIRGVGNRVDRGTGQLIANIEYRHTIRHKKAWAFQLVGFVDAGSWRNPGEPLSDLFEFTTVRLFYGLGLRGIYNKHLETTLRIDYGVDAFDSNQRGFVIGIGQYF